MPDKRPDPYIHFCLTCGVELDTPFLEWKQWKSEGAGPFCSPDCYYIAQTDMHRKEHNALPEPPKSSLPGVRFCDYCKVKFKPKRRNQYCCSSTCYNLHNVNFQARQQKPLK